MPLNRRRFLLSAATAPALSPSLAWSDAGAPRLIAAGRDARGYRLIGLRPNNTLAFDIPLPERGHAAATHPSRPEAIAFARRPGTFALVIDCASGVLHTRLDAPEGRHFYGHGTFSADGALLYTTENAFETGLGWIGVWDASTGYRRLGDFSSGGIGPHDVALMPDGETLVVANGGIRTHPATGRQKLNLSTMAPALTYLRASDGSLVERS